MQHTFIFINKLIIVLNYLPRQSLKTEADKRKVERSLELVEEYSTILRNLLLGHETQEHLQKLHKAHRFDGWVDHVNSVLKAIKTLLDEVEAELQKVKVVVANEPIGQQRSNPY